MRSGQPPCVGGRFSERTAPLRRGAPPSQPPPATGGEAGRPTPQSAARTAPLRRGAIFGADSPLHGGRLRSGRPLRKGGRSEGIWARKTEPGAQEAPGRPRRQNGASEKPRPVAISPGGTRRDSLGGRGRGDGAARSAARGAHPRKSPAVVEITAGDRWRAILPRSPTGLADGLGARECAAGLAPRSPLCRPLRAAVWSAWWVPRSPRAAAVGDSAQLFSCVDMVAQFAGLWGGRPPSPLRGQPPCIGGRFSERTAPPLNLPPGWGGEAG